MIEFVAIPEERIKILRKDKKWKEQLRELSRVDVEINDDVSLESEDVFSLMRAKEVVKAFSRGFDFNDALFLLDEDFILETIDVSEFAGRSKNRQIVLKGRVIGTGGKIKKLIEKEAGVKIAVYGKTISMIGRWNNLNLAKQIVNMILQGSKHSSVMRFIQENRGRL